MKNILPLLSTAMILIVASCGKELLPGGNSGGSGATVNTLAGNGTQGSANGPGVNATFYNPSGIAVDTTGNVYVADFRNNMIRKITAAGVVSTFAGSTQPGSANGIGIYAFFYQPSGVALDAAGNLYVADSYNNLVRKISLAGTVTTLAGTGAKGLSNGNADTALFNSPQGVAVDAAGNVYVADLGNNAIRKISKAGTVITLAGNGNQGAADGLDTSATFNQPTGVAVDVAGNVYVADYGNNLIRKITPAGNTTTLAGSGLAGSANGTGTAASFNGSAGIAVDASGNIYVADYANNAIRKITSAGVVTTINSGAGILNHPYGVAINKSGSIYVANYGNSTILKIGN